MNFRSSFVRAVLVFAVLFSVVATPLSGTAVAQRAASTPDHSAALATIEQKLEARRKELGIPGLALAIVKDDKVILAKGFGYKDFDKQVPVTADTQFAIGSATKAVTALSVLMTADEKKISLDASPRTVLPYFKMFDPETDRDMTIKDLMTHSSGLNRTDLAMLTGALTRQELIRVAGEARPFKKLREAFGYQNLMYTAAGEVVATAQKMPWEEFVPKRIFKPLGMDNSTMSMKQMQRAKDYSFGYSYNFDTKETRLLPFREITQVAPAGSINSSANDMAKWVRFVLNGGTVGGKRLISEASFNEWTKPQIKVDPAGTVHYGLGWFIEKWNGMTVLQHGGNIDGFNSMVAMVPEKKLGFVLLTNVSGSPLGTELMPIIWNAFLGPPPGPKTPASEFAELTGKFGTSAAAVEVTLENSQLVMKVPGQPPYKLEPKGERLFHPAGLPENFAARFLPATGKAASLEMIQPQGNRTLARLTGDEPAAAGDSSAAKELIGKYTGDASGVLGEIKEDAGVVKLFLPGQQPYSLFKRAMADEFQLSPLPDTYYIKAVRGADNKVTKIIAVQPEGEFPFTRSSGAPLGITVEELEQKSVDALGGRDALMKVKSRVTTSTIDFLNQGVTATATSYAKAPNLTATETTFTAVGKKIGTGWDFFNGTTGESAYSFMPAEPLTGKRLEDVRITGDMYGMLDWKSKYKSVTISRVAKVAGEDAYAVIFEPEKGTKFTQFYSTKTFLPVRLEGVIASGTSSIQIPYSSEFSDYRTVDGLKIPFRTVSQSLSNGEVVITVTSVKYNVPLEDQFFAPRKLK